MRAGVSFVMLALALGACTVPTALPGASPTTPSPAAAPGQPTAREAYVPAVELIRQRDPGARLSSAAAAWTPVIDRAALEAGRGGWTFFFYLPGTQETAPAMAAVVVDQPGEARLAQAIPWETPPTLLSDQGWQADSPQAIALLPEACKGLPERDPGAQAAMRLSADASLGGLVWEVQITPGPQGLQEGCEVKVDATTGQVR